MTKPPDFYSNTPRGRTRPLRGCMPVQYEIDETHPANGWVPVWVPAKNPRDRSKDSQVQQAFDFLVAEDLESFREMYREDPKVWPLISYMRRDLALNSLEVGLVLRVTFVPSTGRKKFGIQMSEQSFIEQPFGPI